MAKSFRIALIGHEAPRPPFPRTVFERWAKERGYALAHHDVIDNRVDLPHPDSFDLLIVLGGAPNVPETDLHPWLLDERRLIRQTVESGKAVFGVCLGAQQLATEMGGGVVRKPERVTGWYPVAFTAAGQASGLFAPTQGPVIGLHSHFYGIRLPPGADLLFESKHGPQGFQLRGKPVIGFLTHFEYPHERLMTLGPSHRQLIEQGAITPEQIAAIQSRPDYSAAANAFLVDVLDRFVGKYFLESSRSRQSRRKPTG